jgi:hypothetical protein
MESRGNSLPMPGTPTQVLSGINMAYRPVHQQFSEQIRSLHSRFGQLLNNDVTAPKGNSGQKE